MFSNNQTKADNSYSFSRPQTKSITLKLDCIDKMKYLFFCETSSTLNKFSLQIDDKVNTHSTFANTEIITTLDSICTYIKSNISNADIVNANIEYDGSYQSKFLCFDLNRKANSHSIQNSAMSALEFKKQFCDFCNAVVRSEINYNSPMFWDVGLNIQLECGF